MTAGPDAFFNGPWVHKTGNVLNVMPKSVQPKAKGHLHEIWQAETKADTLRVDDDRVRLFGIDAPESDQSCTRPDGSAWQCGQAATQALETMIVAGRVDCEMRDVDRYGRSVAICQSGSVELNREMVAQGLAVAYREYSRRYVGDERAAREIERGIWATEFVMPQEWRSR